MAGQRVRNRLVKSLKRREIGTEIDVAPADAHAKQR